MESGRDVIRALLYNSHCVSKVDDGPEGSYHLSNGKLQLKMS